MTRSAPHTVRPHIDPWIRRISRGANPRLRLICFPYAGGGSSVFRAWPDHLPEWVEVCAVVLPGREDRFREPPMDNLESLVEALAEALLPFLDRPFALFGHSLGALISFELARQLRRQQGPVPAVHFASGAAAPQMCATETPIHQLPEAAFLRELRRLNGTPPELLKNEELMQLFLPTLRADFKIYEEYVYAPCAPLECAIAAYGGCDDREVTEGQLRDWRSQTRDTFSMRLFPGDHFFLQTAERSLLRAVSQDLAVALRRQGQTRGHVGGEVAVCPECDRARPKAHRV